MKNLGKKGTCKVSGFEGIATAKVNYLNGCVQYCITPKVKDNVFPESQYIDIGQIDFEVEKKVSIIEKLTGGPQYNCPK